MSNIEAFKNYEELFRYLKEEKIKQKETRMTIFISSEAL